MRRLFAYLSPTDSAGFYVLPHIVLILLVIFAFVLGAGVGGVGGYLVRDHQGFYEKRYQDAVQKSGISPPAGKVPVKVGQPLKLAATGSIDFQYFTTGNNDQNSIGVCQGESAMKEVSYDFNRLQAQQTGKNPRWFFSPRYPYDVLSHGDDNGSFLEQYLPILAHQGVPRWRDMPYGKKAGSAGLPAYRVDNPVPDRFHQAAAPHTFPEISRTQLFANQGAGMGGVDLIKQQIIEYKNPVNVAMPAFEQLFQAGQAGYVDVPKDGEKLYGYHAMVGVRVDDNLEHNGVRGWVLFSQHWGRQYGVNKDGVKGTTNGYVWVSDRFLAQYAFSVAVMHIQAEKVQPVKTSYPLLAVPSTGERLFGLHHVWTVINSAYWNEAGLLMGIPPEGDTDYMVPTGWREAVRLPGRPSDTFWYYGAVNIYGSGIAWMGATPSGGNFAFLHLSNVGAAAASGAKPIPVVGSPPDQAENTSEGDELVLRLAYQKLQEQKPKAVILHGGDYIGTSGWPTDPAYGNGSAGEWNAHLCLITSSTAAQWFYDEAMGYHGKAPPPPPKRHKTAFSARKWRAWTFPHHKKSIPYKHGKRLRRIAQAWQRGHKNAGGIVRDGVWHPRNRKHGPKVGYMQYVFVHQTAVIWPYRHWSVHWSKWHRKPAHR